MHQQHAIEHRVHERQPRLLSERAEDGGAVGRPRFGPLLGRHHGDNAARAFAEGYQKYPDSGKAPDNLLKLGMSLGEIGSKSDACTALGQLDTQFPGAPANIKERATSERQRLGC